MFVEKYIKPVLNPIMALLLLLAWTGVSFNEHYCHGKLSSVSIFPEILPITSSCKCASHFYQPKTFYGYSTEVLHQKPCCTNFYYFKQLKTEINTQELHKHLFLDVPCIIYGFAYLSKELDSFQDILLPTFRPPPVFSVFFGRNLVLMLSQQRIPLPCDFIV